MIKSVSLVKLVTFVTSFFLLIMLFRTTASSPRAAAALSKMHARENATLVSLVRNADLEEMLMTVQQVQDRFNNKFGYDWVFLNDEEFNEQFKHFISRACPTAKFGVISKDHWGYPKWIDQEKAEKARKAMQDDKVIYGGSESYRHMCRYESGFFYRHELMQQYRYYWRVEPKTRHHCDIDYDLFKYMRANNKKYGWLISLTEFEKTIPNLWNTTKDFLKEHKDLLHPNRLEKFVSEDNLETYNLCHFWSNFEIADMEFWRGEAYSQYFDYLDKSGGFFYERWGDAPVHSIAASLFLDADEIHFFDDVGYYHPPFYHCPAQQRDRKLKCSCLPDKTFDWHESSCLRKYLRAKHLSFDEQKVYY